MSVNLRTEPGSALGLKKIVRAANKRKRGDGSDESDNSDQRSDSDSGRRSLSDSDSGSDLSSLSSGASGDSSVDSEEEDHVHQETKNGEVGSRYKVSRKWLLRILITSLRFWHSLQAIFSMMTLIFMISRHHLDQPRPSQIF